jgi:hypothetical protein
MCRAQFHDTPAHVLQNYQSQIRLSVKLKFLVGLAHKITEAIGTTNMQREQLGMLAAKAGMVEGHTQYEMFYAGAPFVVSGHSYRTFDWGAARGMIDHLLSTYEIGEALKPAAE